MNRRHDLDALRGIAMLLGIGIHGVLSFFPFPWPVQDTRQSIWLGLFFCLIHGFRMPLFFLVSGFFTAMLWRRRGLEALLWHRFRRIFVPLVIGTVTIVPLINLSRSLVGVTASKHTAESGGPSLQLAGETGDAGAKRVEFGRTETKHDAGPKRIWRLALLLMFSPVFHHLWFLWFLVWLVLGYSLFTLVVGPDFRVPLRWLIVSPLRYFLLIPITLLPQFFMGLVTPVFGPATSAGILPAPHILFYYGIFFAFGALYYDCDDEEGHVGKRWWLTLPLGLLIVFPLGVDFTFGSYGWREQLLPEDQFRLASVIFQATYAWLMTFGLMGAFRFLLSDENKTLRYVSDSSYWLYLAHLPPIIIAQAVVRTWQVPALLKFILVCVVVTAILLLCYEYCVRYTWLGSSLSGPRKRPEPEPMAAER